MTAPRVWKIALGLVLLFALGGVCGATFLHRRSAAGAGRMPIIERWSERWFAQTAERLDLRADQMEAMRPIVAQMQGQLRDLQKETATRATDIVRQSGRQLWDKLDATQRARYQALPQEQKLRLRGLPEN